MGIRINLEKIYERVEKVCDKSGRNPDSVKLVAVSKRFDIDKILEAFEEGIRDFGENYAQEFRDKYKEIDSSINELINWHFIGNLQKNKIKYVAGKTTLIHTLDSESLAEGLNKKADDLDIVINCLLEVNISGETNKSGIQPSEVIKLAENLSGLQNIKVTGLMGMPPYFSDPEKTRPYFVKLRELRDSISNKNSDIKELSMGMSHDFEVAISEGATIIRVGSAIFGPRN